MKKYRYTAMLLTVFLSVAMLYACTPYGTDNSPAAGTADVPPSADSSGKTVAPSDTASSAAPTGPDSTSAPLEESVTAETISEAAHDSPPADYVILTDETAEMIMENLDILTADYINYRNERDVASAHPEEFSKITSLGEEALPYLGEIINDFGSDKHVRRIIAAYASYVIKPELYELIFNSPDGKYTLEASPYNFFGLHYTTLGIDYNDLRLTDNTTDKVIYNQSPGNSYNNITVEWSPDIYTVRYHIIIIILQ